LYKSLVEETTLIRDWIAAERRELAGLLAGLSAEQWDAPTLCEGWAVRHVVAHVTMPFRYSAPRLAAGLVLARGSFRRMSDGIARRDGLVPPAQLLAWVAGNAEHPWKPPGGGYDGALTHDVIHGLDIAAGLGLPLDVPAQPMTAVLRTITGAQSLRHFGVRVCGLRLEATDVGWTSGDGEPVRGRAQDLALALTGRRVADGALSGPGAGLLAGREGAGAPR
jgi:uncharacterized protein (TIGR03083 family)